MHKCYCILINGVWCCCKLKNIQLSIDASNCSITLDDKMTMFTRLLQRWPVTRSSPVCSSSVSCSSSSSRPLTTSSSSQPQVAGKTQRPSPQPRWGIGPSLDFSVIYIGYIVSCCTLKELYEHLVLTVSLYVSYCLCGGANVHMCSVYICTILLRLLRGCVAFLWLPLKPYCVNPMQHTIMLTIGQSVCYKNIVYTT